MPRREDRAGYEDFISPDHFPEIREAVAVGASGEKRMTFLVVEVPSGHRAELYQGSRRVMRAEASAVPREGKAFAVLTDPLRLKAGGSLLGEGGSGLKVTRGGPAQGRSTPGRPAKVGEGGFGSMKATRDGPDGGWLVPTTVGDATLLGSAEEFPTDVMGLAGLSAVVIADFDTATLSQVQMGALRDYVGLGGSLVMAGGVAWRRTLESLPKELVPLKPSGTTTALARAVAPTTQTSPEATMSIVIGSEARGRTVLAAAGGVPLIIQAPYGAGRVVQLTYDPFAEPFAADATLRTAILDRVLQPALETAEPSPHPPGVTEGGPQPWSGLLDGSHRPGLPVWSSVTGLLLLYLVMLGPVTHGVLSARRRRLDFLLVPVIAVLVTGGVLVLGPGRTADRVIEDTVAIQTRSPSGIVVTESFQIVSAGGGAKTEIGLSSGAVATSVFTDCYQFGPQRIVTPRLDHGGSIRPIVQIGLRPVLRSSVPASEATVVQTVSVGRRDGGLEAHLQVVGSRIVGRITNHGPRALDEVRLQLAQGVQARLPNTLPAGAAAEVALPLQWPDFRFGSSDERRHDVIVFAIADRALSRDDQVALVARVHPPIRQATGGDRRLLSEVVETVALETG